MATASSDKEVPVKSYIFDANVQQEGDGFTFRIETLAGGRVE
jgi:hypothetical protein